MLETRHSEGGGDEGLERDVHAQGHELLRSLRAAGGETLRRDAFTDWVTQWAMADDALKVELFRFIDVLPALRSSAEVARHLREYLLRPGLHLPPGMATLLHLGVGTGLGTAVAARVAQLGARQMARRFIAGSNLDEAMGTIRRLRQQRMGYTLDLLGEAVTSEAEAQSYQGKYLCLLVGLSHEDERVRPLPQLDQAPWGPVPRVNVSLKASSLYSRFDPVDIEGTVAAVKERLRPILSEARQAGAHVHVDMEQYAYKDVTLRLFRETLMEEEFRDWADVGIVIQAYLHDSAEDLAALRDWALDRGAPVWVRLVKGAYWDYETVVAAQKGWPVPVFTQKWETDASFERLSRFLLQSHPVLRPAIGSHNVRSVAYTMATADHLGLVPGTVEYQVLYGMGDRLGAALARRGERVRVYVPYGELLPGMAYLVRRLLENTSNESFLRQSFVEHVSEDDLLRNPLETGREMALPGPSLQPQRTEALRHGAPTPGGRPGTATGDGHARRRTSRAGATPLAGRRGGAAPAAPTAAPSVPPPIPHPTSHIPHPTSRIAPFTNVPETDFSREESRRRMREALADVRGRFGRHYPLVVDGREVRTAQEAARVNPSRISEVVGVVSMAGAAEGEAAVAAARVAFPAWCGTPAAERSALLFRTAGVLRRRRLELAAWEVYETGKEWREADADVAEAIDYLEYYGREMLRLDVPRRRDFPGESNEYFYEGRGVAAIIAPWNFPLAILTGMASAALVAGNTVILKPSGESTIVGYQLMDAFREAGAPPGVLHYLPGRGSEVGALLVEHPDVSLIAFTGSKEVGLSIYRSAAEVRPGQRDIKRVIAELGGKNAILIDADADLDEAVPGVVASAFGYQGQKCSACSRVIVLDAVYDAFVERLSEATRSLRLGPAEDPGTQVGPVIDAGARNRILRYLNIGRQEGKVLVEVDPGALAGEGYFVPPTVFTDVDPHATIAQEEIFGPVLVVLRAKEFDEALRVALDTDFALTGGLYSRSPEHIERARREFRVGNLYINRKTTGAIVDRQPFGGFRMSGVGSKAGGPDYLLQFMLPRTVTEWTLRRGFAPEDARDVGRTGGE